MMSVVLSKVVALDPRYHKLKFSSKERKNLIWEQLKIELHESNPENRNVDIDYNEI